ncbi:MAG: hypothetical protein ABIJ25_10295 [Pseudomonadota bacterium]
MLCILIANGAKNRGHSGFAYFVLSLLLSPLVGFVAVLMAKDETKRFDRPGDV